MCRKLWPLFPCNHEQIPAQSTRHESCGNGPCPEYSWGWGYYTLETDCGNLRCSTAVRKMFDEGKVKVADWKLNYSARAGSRYGGGSSSSVVGYGGSAGPSSVGLGYSNGGNIGYAGNGRYAGYGGYGGFAPMLPGPSTACPAHDAPLLPHLPLSYPNGGSGYYQGYNPVLWAISAPPASFYGPFLPPFPASGDGGHECPPPPPMHIFLRIRR